MLEACGHQDLARQARALTSQIAVLIVINLVIGFAGGDIPKIPLNLPLLKGASVVGGTVNGTGSITFRATVVTAKIGLVTAPRNQNAVTNASPKLNANTQARIVM